MQYATLQEKKKELTNSSDLAFLWKESQEALINLFHNLNRRTFKLNVNISMSVVNIDPTLAGIVMTTIKAQQLQHKIPLRGS